MTGAGTSAGAGAGAGVSSDDAPLLVRTWLHDEGSHSEVVELGRDVLMAAGPGVDITAWGGLLTHMSTRGMNRSLWQTVLMLARSRADVLSTLITTQGQVRGCVLRALRQFCGEVTQKAGQVRSLLGSKRDSGAVEADLGALCPSVGRVLLVERTRVDWDEAPEELCLSMVHLSALWANLSPLLLPHGDDDDEATQTREEIRRACVALLSVAAGLGGEVRSAATGGMLGWVVGWYAERAVLSLLGPALETGDAGGAGVVRSVLQGVLGGRAVDKSEGGGLLWRVFAACCANFSAATVGAVLEGVVGVAEKDNSHRKHEHDTLRVLITSAAGCWHTGPRDRAAASLLLQWCIANVAAAAAAASDTDNDASKGNDTDSAKRNVKRISSSAFSSLRGSDRRAVALAVEVMGLKVDRKLLMLMTKTTA